MVATSAGVPVRLLRAAVPRWASCPGEAGAEITAVESAQDTAEDARRRERQLLAG